ncbi:DNA cytosine methyltransferase [Glycomyces terrestris]|uniref:DNA (cytosine-5-)-methyltransferase n=1 Tax=Glycomyces terrestris TaxID=2493553 RepID=A0A426URC0_9ACTN|nr:DNA cytosine methyltransferase [Glycomyces terrestris]RRR95558.1 DNA cytosine methyltransferase [Glycomyces terrestris]
MNAPTPLRIGSLCSGYGGLDMAVSAVLDAETVWHCQFDPDDPRQYAARILAHHWPAVPNHGDITRTDWAAVEPVDILTAGFPCQPVSNAGKRKGQADARWIWPAVADAVRVLRPRLVFLENVAAITGRNLGAVLDSLAALGYDASWTCLHASDIGAPHRRERWFCLAWHADDQLELQPRRPVQPPQPHPAGDASRPAAHAHHASALAERDRQPQRPEADDEHAVLDAPGRVLDWGPYAPAIAQWEHVMGRPTPFPTEQGRNGPRLAARFVEWLMGLPAGFVTGLDLPRTAQLRALGNGVVPHQGAAALADLLTDYQAATAGRELTWTAA